ncbi:MAG: tetratricopeptide repeat protein [Spirochaetota bacterium]
MQRTDERDTKTRIADAVSQFLTRYWKIILGILVIVAVALIGVFTYLEIRSARENAAARAFEELQDDYESWQEAEEEERESLEDTVYSQIEEITGEYSGMYAASRARIIGAEIYWEKEEWDEAAAEYETVADEFSNSHIGPVALFNAAAAEEAGGQLESAAELLDTFVERYADGEPTPELTRALFARGRVYEQLEDFDSAADSYERLVDEHSDSSWTNLARNRIIALKTQGRISE